MIWYTWQCRIMIRWKVSFSHSLTHTGHTLKIWNPWIYSNESRLTLEETCLLLCLGTCGLCSMPIGTDFKKLDIITHRWDFEYRYSNFDNSLVASLLSFQRIRKSLSWKRTISRSEETRHSYDGICEKAFWYIDWRAGFPFEIVQRDEDQSLKRLWSELKLK